MTITQDPFTFLWSEKDDPFVYSLAKMKREYELFGIVGDVSDSDMFPMVMSGSGLIIGRYGYSGMGDYYSNTHGNTGMGFF